MSQPSPARVRPDRGYCRVASLPKGPNGRSLCRQCQAEVPSGKKSFCGPDCVHDWKLTTRPGYLRRYCFRRDKGICRQCSLDTIDLCGLYDGLPKDERAAFLASLPFRWDGSGEPWQADHIIPVVDGGGQCGLDNIQTLCLGCHRKKSAAQTKARAAAKRAAKAAAKAEAELTVDPESN